MGKTYLRYRLADTFGLISSPAGNVALDASGGLAFSPQLEGVGVWSLKRGLQVSRLLPPGEDSALRSEVCRLQCAPQGRYLAVGYVDGMLRTFDTDSASVALTLNGHRRAISALCYSRDGSRLASGSRDTDVIVWDTVGETGVARLKGHRDEVTGLSFLGRGGDRLVSCSKDTLIKVWDCAALLCLQTVVGVRCEVWGLALSTCGSRLLAAAADSRLRVWAIGAGASASTVIAAAAEGGGRGDAMEDGVGSSASPLQPMGSFQRTSSEKAAAVAAHSDGVHFGVLGSGRIVEVFRRRSAPEAKARTVRRLKRAREKLAKAEAKRAAAAAAAAAGGEMAQELAAMGGGEEAEEDELGFLPAGTTLGTLDALIATILSSSAASSSAQAAPQTPGASALGTTVAGDEFELVGIVQCAGKARVISFGFLPSDARGGAASLNLLLACSDNTMEQHALLLSSRGDGKGKAAAAPQSGRHGGEEEEKEEEEGSAALAGAAEGGQTITTASGVTAPLGAVTRKIDIQGHRSDIRALACSADGALLLSASQYGAKVWNSRSGAPLRTLDIGKTQGLCCAFGPGGRHALVGCKDGSLKLFDLASGDLVDEHEGAHGGAALYALAVRHDGRGCVSGGGDKECKFWEFELMGVGGGGGGGGGGAAQQQPPQLRLIHTRTLRLGDEVRALCYSRHTDSTKLVLAVALLDSTVKVFFEDTLKFSLSLYGHKLPIMAMDISADSTMLVTASSDKNVKLWGLDFGDCHKSFFAHDDAVTGVAFVANTHYFFTCSKDKCVKYWDGDRFIAINTLGGGVGLGATHKAEVWALAAAPDGSFVATAGGDRSLRIWRRGSEQVFPEEEREAELEGVWGRDVEGDGEAVLSREDAVGPVGLDGQGIPTEEGKVVTAPLAAPGGGSSSSAGGGGGSATAIVASASAESSRGGERLFEALAVAIKEQEAWERYVEECDMAEELGEDVGGVVPPQLNPALLGATPTAHVVKTLRSIAPGDLDQVLLLLPFSSAFILLRFLALALAKGQAIELGARAVLLLLRCHGAQLTASGRHGAFLRLLRDSVLRALGEARDTVGFNAAGLGALEACLAGEVLVKLEFGKALSSSAESGQGGPSKGKFGDGLVNAGKRQKVRLL